MYLHFIKRKLNKINQLRPGINKADTLSSNYAHIQITMQHDLDYYFRTLKSTF